jgi:hypothetical protein
MYFDITNNSKAPSYLRVGVSIVIKYEGRDPKTDKNGCNHLFCELKLCKKKINNKINNRIITPTVILYDRVSALCNTDGIIKTFLIGRMIYERDALKEEICYEKEEPRNSPTYIEMISDALRKSYERKLILNPELPGPGPGLGKRQLYLSRAGIKKWIIYNMAAHVSVQTIDRALRNALWKGVVTGKLIQYKQSFCLPKDK